MILIQTFRCLSSSKHSSNPASPPKAINRCLHNVTGIKQTKADDLGFLIHRSIAI